LAYMLSKYLRELALRAFNVFWCARIDGLRPTAGYPVDADRFLTQINEVRHKLAISDDQLIRVR